MWLQEGLGILPQNFCLVIFLQNGAILGKTNGYMCFYMCFYANTRRKVGHSEAYNYLNRDVHKIVIYIHWYISVQVFKVGKEYTIVS